MSFKPTPLPPAFTWLAAEPAPRHLLAALKWHGLRERMGPGSNPEILAMYARVQATGVGKAYGGWYDDDDKAWCGLGLADTMRDAGRDIPAMYLAAAAWADWGRPAPRAELGAVLVFNRPGGHHVGLYVAEGPGVFWVLGFNQGNACSIVPIEKTRLLKGGIREPVWKSKPRNIRPVFIDAGGRPVSRNEA